MRAAPSLRLVTLLLVLAGCASARADREPAASASLPPRDYWPTAGWRRASPASQGMDSARLAAAERAIADSMPAVRSFLVVRHGWLVADRYFGGASDTTRFQLRSVTKSVVSALVGIAIERGLLQGPGQRVADLLPQYFDSSATDARKLRLTLRHLLTMTSGLAWSEEASGSIIGRRSDWAGAILAQPMLHTPGASFEYSSGNAHVLSAIVSRRARTSTLAFANERLFGPLGFTVPVTAWSADPSGVSSGGSGLDLTADEMARLGWLYLNEGRWGDRQVVPASWVRQSIRVWSHPPNAPPDGGYGYLWWIAGGTPPMYYAAGAGGQYIAVIPSLDLVVVMTADPRGQDWSHLRVVRQYVVAAVR